MSSGVIFFNHSPKYCARLLVSLYSLRQHYAGPVTILDTGETGGIVEQIATGLRAEVLRIPFVARRRNSCYNMKASLWRDSPYDINVFLDSDTLVARPLDRLFQLVAKPGSPGFLVTQFSDWNTCGTIISGRIRRWLDIWQHGAKDLAAMCLDRPYPAINTGVFAFQRSACTPLLEDWERVTHAGARLPFTDELGCQVVIRRHEHMVVGSEFNASPIYYKGAEPVVVHHFHGSKMVARPDGRGSEGHKIWWPVFGEIWEANAANVQTWAPAGDEHLSPWIYQLRMGQVV